MVRREEEKRPVRIGRRYHPVRAEKALALRVNESASLGRCWRNIKVGCCFLEIYEAYISRDLPWRRVHLFFVVCSNDQERHSVSTTYRHRFRLELLAVMQEARSSGHARNSRHRGSKGGGHASSFATNDHCRSPVAGSSSSRPKNSDPLRTSNPQSERTSVHFLRPSAGSPPGSAATEPRARESDPRRISAESPDEGKAPEKASSEQRAKGVTVEEFSEALRRCPEMLEAFGSQLAARLRHKHRPIWMAPFSRKGG